MSIIDWVKNEVDIVKKTESLDEYSLLCLDSAVKAYNCLMEDEHSGASIKLTQNILNKLINCIPLTPILDTPDVWTSCMQTTSDNGDIIECYSNIRKPGLYKDVNTKTGEITFKDVNRVVAHKKDSNVIFYQGLVSEVVDEQYPITFPYTGADIYDATVVEFDDWEGTHYVGIEDVSKNHEECTDFKSKYFYYDENEKPQPIDKDDFYDVEYYSEVKEVMSLPENQSLKDSFEILKNYCIEHSEQDCADCIFKRGIQCLVCDPSHWDDEWNATFDDDE